MSERLVKALERSIDALDRLTDKVDRTGFSESDEFNNALDEIDIGRAALADHRAQAGEVPELPEADAWGGQFYSDRSIRTYGQQCYETGREQARALRELLAIHVAGASLYTDDGELSDYSVHPSIDFLRDTPEQIKAKLIERGQATQPSAVPDAGTRKASAESVAFSDVFAPIFEALAGSAATDLVKDAARLAAACAFDKWEAGRQQGMEQPTSPADSAVASGAWVSVDERLPDMMVPVLGYTAGGSLSVFARDDVDGEGWLWARASWIGDLADPRGFEADDDYDVKFWQPLPIPPQPGQEGS